MMFHHLKSFSDKDNPSKALPFLSHFQSINHSLKAATLYKLQLTLLHNSSLNLNLKLKVEEARRGRTLKVMHKSSLYHNVASILVLTSLLPMSRLVAEGRATPNQVPVSQGTVEEEERITRSQIGSRPPSCDGRCYSCEHCEAIQVPTNPQVDDAKGFGAAGVSRTTTAAYTRGDYESNYKPMSWKCKCGSSIFNP
uniref:Epidermal patterning factor-like protein n=1 Tax=Kalanchoe fedtschenkoi TaxID=63787 RepID=A0A7N0TMD9_KALFE